MKRLLYFFLMFLCVSSLYAQKQVERVTMPTKDDKVFYEQIVEVDSKETKDKLYIKALKWSAENFVDSKEAIKVSDKQTGKIVGSGVFTLRYNKLLTMDDLVTFDFDVTLKDGRYRVQVYNIQTKGVESDYPFRSIDKDYLRQLSEDKFSYRKQLLVTFKMIDQKINDLLDSLKNDMKKSSVADDF